MGIQDNSTQQTQRGVKPVGVLAHETQRQNVRQGTTQRARERVDRTYDATMGAASTVKNTANKVVDRGGDVAISAMNAVTKDNRVAKKLRKSYQPTPLDNETVLDGLARSDERQLVRFYIQSLGDKNLFGEYNFEPEKIVRHIRGKHSMYASGLVYSAFGKLMQDRRGSTFMEAGLTFVLMYAASPNFRDTVGVASDKITHAIDLKKQKLLKPFKDAIFWGNNKTGLQAKLKMNEVAGRFDDFLTTCKNGDSDLPMTEMAAGATLVRLSDHAYEAMQKGAQPALVMDRYNACVKELAQQWDKHSLDMKTVSQAARDIVAQKIAEDPTYASHYVETVAGHVRPETRVDKEGYFSRWSGQWDVQGNGVLPEDALFFTPRAPQSVDEHLTNIGSAMVIDVRRNSRQPGANDTALDANVRKNHNTTVMHDVLVGYCAGWDFRDKDVRTGAGEGTEPDVRRAAMTTMRSMLAAMDADGISKQQQAQMIRTVLDQVGESLSYGSSENAEVFQKACDSGFEKSVDEYVTQVKKDYKKPAWVSQPRLSWNDGATLGGSAGPSTSETDEVQEEITNEQDAVQQAVHDAQESVNQQPEQQVGEQVSHNDTDAAKHKKWPQPQQKPGHGLDMKPAELKSGQVTAQFAELKKQGSLMKPAGVDEIQSAQQQKPMSQHEEQTRQHKEKPVQLKDIVRDHTEETRPQAGKHREKRSYPETKVLPEAETIVLNAKPLKGKGKHVRTAMKNEVHKVQQRQTQLESSVKTGYTKSKDDGGLSL